MRVVSEKPKSKNKKCSKLYSSLCESAVSLLVFLLASVSGIRKHFKTKIINYVTNILNVISCLKQYL